MGLGETAGLGVGATRWVACAGAGGLERVDAIARRMQCVAVRVIQVCFDFLCGLVLACSGVSTVAALWARLRAPWPFSSRLGTPRCKPSCLCMTTHTPHPPAHTQLHPRPDPGSCWGPEASQRHTTPGVSNLAWLPPQEILQRPRIPERPDQP